MSKSKLNKRQLKKISKVAAEYVLRNHKYVSVNQLLFDRNGEDQFHGEFGFWSVGGYDGEYDSGSALSYLVDDFYSENTNWREMGELDAPMTLSLPKGFHSQSFAGNVHYMIKFLEAINEQGND